VLLSQFIHILDCTCTINFSSILPLFLEFCNLLYQLFLCISGHKYYYNTKTHVSQWERPNLARKVSVGDGHDQSSNLPRCMGCGGWGVGLVQAWAYCNHCTRWRVVTVNDY